MDFKQHYKAAKTAAEESKSAALVSRYNQQVEAIKECVERIVQHIQKVPPTDYENIRVRLRTHISWRVLDESAFTINLLSDGTLVRVEKATGVPKGKGKLTQKLAPLRKIESEKELYRVSKRPLAVPIVQSLCFALVMDNTFALPDDTWVELQRKWAKVATPPKREH